MHRFNLLLRVFLLIVGIAIVIKQWSIAGVLITAFGASVNLVQLFFPRPVLPGVQIQLQSDFCTRHPMAKLVHQDSKSLDIVEL
jgi:hypothetical protein